MTILHIPHSSVAIPHEYLFDFIISEQDIQRELLKMTDLYTDELFCGQTKIVFPISRLVCDVERFLNPEEEVMSRFGMWICYQNGSDLIPIKRLCESSVQHVISAYYKPHHAQLTAMVEQQLCEKGKCLIVDCHSFPSKALPYEDAGKLRPDVCIGTDAFHSPNRVTQSLLMAVKAHGLHAACDTLFSGTMVPSRYYGRDPRVSSIMIEVNRSLYMDEVTGDKLPRFESVKAMLTDILSALPE